MFLIGSGLERRLEVIIKEQGEKNLRQIAEAGLVGEVEYLDYDQGRNSGCNDRVMIHKLEIINAKKEGKQIF